MDPAAPAHAAGADEAILTTFLAEPEKKDAVVASTMDLLGWLGKRLEAADPDLLWEMVLRLCRH